MPSGLAPIKGHILLTNNPVFVILPFSSFSKSRMAFCSFSLPHLIAGVSGTFDIDQKFLINGRGFFEKSVKIRN